MFKVEADPQPAMDAEFPAVRAFELAVTAVAALWMVMSFTYPFGWDQGIFSWAGGVINRGGIPYRDAWDIKGPLVYYIYALAQAVFGVHLWSIRIIDAALLIAATLSIRSIASVLTSRLVGRRTAIFFFLWYASHSYWHTAQPDGWAGLILLIASVPMMTRTEPMIASRIAFIGLCIGLMTLLKPVYAVFLLLPFIHIKLTVPAQRIKNYALVAVAWILPLAVAIGWFAVRGALAEWVEAYRWAIMYQSLSPGDRMRGLIEYLLYGRVTAVVLPVAIYGAIVLWRRWRPAAIVLGGWAALAVGVVLLQNRFFAYHWMPLLPAAALLAAVGLHAALSRLRALALVFSGVILIHCVAPIIVEEFRFVTWIAGSIDREAYYAAYGEPGEEMKAVSWLREKGRDGNIFIFGWNTGVAWLSGREPVSRFGFSMPLLLDKEDGEIRFRYRREALDAIELHPPRYIVVGTLSEKILGRMSTIDDFPEFADLVRRTYQQAARFGNLTIYEAGPRNLY